MISGSSLYRSVEKEVRKLEKDKRRRNKTLHYTQTEVEQIEAAIGNKMQNLATYIVPRTGQSRINVFSAMSNLAQQRRATKTSNLRDELQALTRKEDTYEAEIDQIEESLSKHYQERKKLRAEVEAALKRDPRYDQLQTEQHHTEEKLNAATYEHKLAVADREEALEYSGSPFIRDLSERGYGTDAYKPNLLEKLLDPILAKQSFVRWQANSHELGILMTAPALAQESIEALTAAWQENEADQLSFERTYENKFELTDLERTIHDTEAAKISVKNKLRETEHTAKDVQARIKDMNAKSGSHYKKLIDRVEKELATYANDTLQQLAQSTPDTTDDSLVAEIIELRNALTQAKDSYAQARQRANSISKEYRKAKEALDEIDNDYDYEISSGLLSSMLRNTQSRNWSKVSRTIKTTGFRGGGGSFGGGGAGGSYGSSSSSRRRSSSSSSSRSFGGGGGRGRF